MRIDRLSNAPDRAGRYYAILSDGTKLRLYRRTVEDFGLYPGLELSEEEMRRLRSAAGEMSAKMRAVRIVAASSVSKQDLQSRLIRKGETEEDARTAVEQARDTLERLAATYDRGRMLREGISTAIVGSVNVGKSTLMNLLAGCEKSIVTDVPGTTRDVVEETVRIGELTLNLWDTAGLRDTADTVEKIGVSRSRERLKRCDLILAVFDGSRPLEAEDLQLLAELDGRLAVGVVNKSDAGCRIDMAEIAAHTGTPESGHDVLQRGARLVGERKGVKETHGKQAVSFL